jgi:hypothetical protein
MHNAALAKLLRHIPAAEQPKLMLVTTSGTEIAIQCFLRIDPECLAFKGRLAGSQDAGRVFFLPFANIDYFGFQQPLKESEFHELFGNLEMPGAAAGAPGAAPTVSGPTSPSNPGTTLAPNPAGTPSEPAASAPRNPLTIKSAVLEKFRARSASNPGTIMRPNLEE